jgi:hypothetical protein
MDLEVGIYKNKEILTLNKISNKVIYNNPKSFDNT